MANLNKIREIVIPDLNEDNRAKYCFVGAGLSTLSNIPDWKTLIDKMYEYLKQDKINDEFTLRNFKEAMDNRKYPTAASIFKGSRMEYKSKQRFFVTQLLDKREPDPVHLALVKLPFDGIITTNFDHLLEDSYTYIHGKSILPYMPSNWESSEYFVLPDKFFIAKLHGDAIDWNTMVLDEESYRQAKWINKLKSKIDGKILFVFGIGGRDYLINKFLFSLSKETKIHLFMLNEACIEYVEDVTAFIDLNIPDNIVPHSDLNKEEIKQLILGLGREFDPDNIIDSPWGEMPIPIFRLNFEKENKRIRDFMFSDKRVAIINSIHGKGLSLFLSQALVDRSQSKNAMVFRIEGKEFLPLEAYVSHIIENFKGKPVEKFNDERKKAIFGWDEISLAHALAVAINELNCSIIIAIEHIERISVNKKIKEFINILLEKTSPKLKLIFTTAEESWYLNKLIEQSNNLYPFHETISIDNISKESLKLICELRGAIYPCTEEIIDKNVNYNINVITLASAILKFELKEFNEIDEYIEENNLEMLCEILLKSLAKKPQTLKVLLTACLFETPRKIKELSYCSDIKKLQEVSDITADLVEHGFLISNNSGKSYSMSTSIRKLLINTLLSKRFKLSSNVNHLINNIGQLFEKKATEHEKDSKISISILYISSALYYYKKSNNREKYQKLVLSIKDTYIKKQQLNILEKWIDEIPSHSADVNLINEFLIQNTKTKIYFLRCLPGKIKESIHLTEKLLKSIKAKKIPYAGYDIAIKNLEFDKGVMLSVYREYKEAMNQFNSIAKSVPKSDNLFDFKVLLRIVQTHISLGHILEAESLLKKIEKTLFRKKLSTEDKRWIQARINRHYATICVIRTLLTDNSILPINENNKEYKQALCYCDECINASRTINNYSGLGEGELKKAQLFFAYKDYSNSIIHANNAIEHFASFPNNRWWRMVCHDLCAKSQALTGQIEKASENLKIAREIWSNYAKEDNLRNCELKFTEALIYYHNGELVKSQNLFLESINFNKTISPCIFKFHLRQIINIEACLGNYDSVKKYIEEYQNINVILN